MHFSDDSLLKAFCFPAVHVSISQTTCGSFTKFTA